MSQRASFSAAGLIPQQLEGDSVFQPSNSVSPPGNKLPGYFRMSLRDKTPESKPRNKFRS
ncbi:MAG: hypothetical protein B6245_09215 [Desulfobacteraceae bacterium 4572_88]|nr:MAG: hypothetical protein B6245_09215 [Desulfobacteraceae bacterium 4572_88]